MAAPTIPGSARDDLDRLRILFLRAHDLDQAVHCRVEVATARPGSGWAVRVLAAGARIDRRGECFTDVVAALVAELTRKVLLRWRSDGGALQLCGVPPTHYDPPDAEVVEMPGGRELPPATSAWEG